MREVPIAAVSGQSLTINEGSNRISLVIKEARGVMVCDLTIGTDVVLLGSRAVAGEMVIPYQYRETIGNFIFQTVGDELPNWRAFGVSQFLFFLTAEELGAIRADN